MLLAIFYQVIGIGHIILVQDSISQRRSIAAKNRRIRERLSWSTFINSVSDEQFRRMFRMTKECFNKLCRRIVDGIGEKKFKSEEYIESVSKLESIYTAHEATSGGYISGEVKLALTLRMLAGGSYLDLSLIYHCADTYVTTIFHEVINEWLCNDAVICFPNESYLMTFQK